ncbi:MAG: RDD family protein [Gammaproteobacteria bacterium]
MNTETNPYERPDAPLADSLDARPVGFWMRVVASIVDTILMVLVIAPILYLVYGPDYFTSTTLSHGALDIIMQYLIPAVVVIVFWVYKSATPGKMIIGAKIIDANTGGPASTGKLILRYVGYYIAAIPLGLGILWVGWDRRKQGWHDKIAGTMVVGK